MPPASAAILSFRRKLRGHYASWLRWRVLQGRLRSRLTGRPFPRLSSLPASSGTVGVAATTPADEGAIQVMEYAEATLLADEGGAVVVSQDGQLIAEPSLLSYAWGPQLHPVFTRWHRHRSIAVPPAVSFVVTPQASHNYYHWLVDALPRAIALASHTESTRAHLPLVTHAPLLRFQVEALELLGWHQASLIPLPSGRLARVTRALVPTHRPKTPAGLHRAAQALRRAFLPSTPAAPTRQLYLGRTGARTRNLTNQADLLPRLTALGFTALDPEKMTFAEQIATFDGATTIVAVHGAALANLVFCRAGTLVVEIMNRYCPKTFYADLCQALDLRYLRVWAEPVGPRVSDPMHGNHAHLHLPSAALEELIATVSHAPTA